MAGARLEREDGRIRRQLDIGIDDLGRVRIEHDRSVHLRQLVKKSRRVVEIQLDATGEQERQLVRISNHDHAARARVKDVVEPLAQRGPRRDHLERPYEPGRLARLELCNELIPGTRRHEGRFYRGLGIGDLWCVAILRAFRCSRE